MRATLGWRAVRVVVSENDRVVAAVQMLMRRLPAGGRIGFVSRRPVVPKEGADLVTLVFDEMMATGKANGAAYLGVHAPRGCDRMGNELMLRGLRPNVYEFDYTASVYVDLRPNLDEILARMRRTTGRHPRTPDKSGVTVRRGSEADLPIFNRLKDTHAARLGHALRRRLLRGVVARARAARTYRSLPRGIRTSLPRHWRSSSAWGRRRIS